MLDLQTPSSEYTSKDNVGVGKSVPGAAGLQLADQVFCTVIDLLRLAVHPSYSSYSTSPAAPTNPAHSSSSHTASLTGSGFIPLPVEIEGVSEYKYRGKKSVQSESFLFPSVGSTGDDGVSSIGLMEAEAIGDIRRANESNDATPNVSQDSNKRVSEIGVSGFCRARSSSEVACVVCIERLHQARVRLLCLAEQMSASMHGSMVTGIDKSG